MLVLALLLSGCALQNSVAGECVSVPVASPPSVEATTAPEIAEDPRPEEVRILSAFPTDRSADCYAEVYESLYTPSEAGLLPLLAHEEPRHESGSAEYRIALRSGLCSSAGQVFDAEEAAFAYTAYAHSPEDALLLTAEATEEGELRLLFKRELQPAEEEDWFTAVPLFDREYLGTGPYRIETESESELLLVPNEHYGGGKGRQNVQRIRYLFSEDAAEKVIALETDKADMANGLLYEDAVDFLPGGSYSDLFTTAEYYSAVGRFLLPNVGKGSALESEELRLALFAALDCAALADELGGRACNALGNPDCTELTEQLQTYQSAVSGERPAVIVSLSLLCPQSGTGKRCAEALAVQLESKGYALRLYALPDEDYALALESGEGWDLALVETKATHSAVAQWMELWNYRSGTALLRGAQGDATLINLLQTLSDGRAAAADCVHRLQERVYNHALALALPQMNEPRVLPLWVSKAVLNEKGAILPGACEYEG